MKNLWIILYFLSLSFNVNAEWSNVGSTVDGPIYIDFSTKVKTSNGYSVYFFYDFGKYKTIAGRRYNSRVDLVEYNCSNKTSRMNKVVIYDNQKIVDQINDKSPWSIIDPTSIDVKLFSLVCKA